MSVAMLFPGQGEQQAGMLHRLPDGSDDVLDEASAALGTDVALLDEPAALAGTFAVQVALLVTGTAWGRAAERDGVVADYLAGHSVGLWSAAVCAGAIGLADAVRLVALRATTMERCSPPGSGMLAVEGLRPQAVEGAAASVRETGGAVWASNVNSDTQLTVSGDLAGLVAITSLLRDAGARRVTRLDVAVPAHTPLMGPAEAAVREVLADVAVRRPAVPIAGNVSGQTIFTAAALREDLSKSISRGVRWNVGTQVLAARGVDVWVQVPPGRSLLGLVPHGTGIAMTDLGTAEVGRVVRARRR